MPTYQHESRIRAPFEDVWDFHSGIEGLTEVTPAFMNLRVEASRGPDGEPDPEVLEEGATVDLSMRPFGVGPRQGWTSTIVERRESEGAALFRDEMSDGPFPSWTHTHSFYADGAETIARDRVEYRLPFGELGHLADPFAVVGFEPMFRYRHAETRRLLE
ncbi:SRPBCC family protein [Halococcus sp. IIIV-5B]|uniref:SRPBCC family protein n=1 Tax=Halococcus sp. IIIV-5B TaxID=2321230 RepID=UPI000E762C92|nr:SRPBCC family protein [Halococcus sp. IIIV-5B]RJT05401.1 cyclase [Halococcus sp. IIIV-5B]